MALRDRIDNAIKAIDSQVMNIKAFRQVELDALAKKREALVAARRVVSDQVEEAIRQLELAGIAVEK